METILVTGSHGAIVVHAASGHIIRADSCSCDDCAEHGGYQSYRWFDPAGFEASALASGHADILDTSFVCAAGIFTSPMRQTHEVGADGAEWFCRADLLLLPPPSYHWTEEAGEIAQLGALADAIEIAGCAVLDGGEVERCDDEPASLWAVYFHFPASRDAAGLNGAICIADRPTVAQARAYAADLASRFALPVNDFTGDAA